MTLTSFRRALLAVVVLATASAGAALAGTATAAPGSDDFRAGEVYRGDFPDPSLLRVGTTYYAYATNTGGNHLPSMTSQDLRTWFARPSETGRWFDNDALPTVASWAATHYVRGKWRSGTWAPSVAEVGGRYVAAYVLPRSYHPEKLCISVATASQPLGPFVDRTRRPLVCRHDRQGSIDPQIFVSGSRAWLLWKNEGIPGGEPTRIWVRRLNGAGTGFIPGYGAHNLLTTARRWEGNVIENPAMVRYAGRYYLFYSGNRWSTAAYATGYAICRTPHGPCKRAGSRPLLASGRGIAGPGGAVPVLDTAGRLRLGYAAWDAGHVGYPTRNLSSCMNIGRGCNQRRLHVATLAVGARGKLRVTRRG
jgi:beta-xylosidase